jgi:hypothetical protein
MVKNSTKTNNVSFIQIYHCSGRKLKDSSEVFKSLYSDTSVTQRQSVYGSETISVWLRDNQSAVTITSYVINEFAANTNFLVFGLT